MKAESGDFNHIVEQVYSLPLEYREELMMLLEHSIADSRRDEIQASYRKAQSEQKNGKLKFSSSVVALKKML